MKNYDRFIKAMSPGQALDRFPRASQNYMKWLGVAALENKQVIVRYHYEGKKVERIVVDSISLS